MIDSTGIFGLYLHYAFLFTLFGGALMVFFSCWRRGRLDMDEEPKFQLFEEEEDGRNS